MKFLIAGLGSIGRRHLRNLLALGERDILLYRTHQATLPDEDLAKIPVETDLAAALAHKPDAVIIANPTALHLSIAIPAAKQGCHLLLEKPVSNALDGIPDLQKAVKLGGGRVLVGFQFRFHPGLQFIDELLAKKAIGKVLSVRAHWGEYLPGWHPWEDFRQSYSARPDLGGGVILTLCHPLDYLRGLLGEVDAVWAFRGNSSDLNIAVEDTAEIGLRFVDGATGTVHLDYVQRPPAHHLELIGTRGTIRWDNADGNVHWYQTDAGTWEKMHVPPGFERNDLFLAEMQHFLEVVRGETAPICTLQDGIRALELAIAAQDSDQEGRLVLLNHTLFR